jgi:hypothetical protein
MIRCQNLLIQSKVGNNNSFELTDFDFIHSHKPGLIGIFCLFLYNDSIEYVILTPSFNILSNNVGIKNNIIKYFTTNKDDCISYHTLLNPLFNLKYIRGNNLNNIIFAGNIYKNDNNRVYIEIVETKNVIKMVKSTIDDILVVLNIDKNNIIFKLIDPHHLNEEMTYYDIFNNIDDKVLDRAEYMIKVREYYVKE